MPREGHDSIYGMTATNPVNFNPRAPRGARHYPSKSFDQVSRISIHVPREGHDPTRLYRKNGHFVISIHVPREGHDPPCSVLSHSNSTISIHVPREGHDAVSEGKTAVVGISIHVPREGHDDTYHDNYLRFGISIHVPREGHDGCYL